MKKTYEKPTLTRRDTLQAITAGANCFVSPFFGDNCDLPE